MGRKSTAGRHPPLDTICNRGERDADGRHSTKWPALTLTVLLLLTLSDGCEQLPDGGGVGPTRSFSPDTPPSPVAVIVDPIFAARLQVETPRRERAPDGRLRALARIRNVSGENVEFHIQTTFLDAAGRPLDERPVWERVTLPARQTYLHLYRSLWPRAVDYRLEISDHADAR